MSRQSGRPATIALRYGQGSLEFPLPALAEILHHREPVPVVSFASFARGLADLLPTLIPAGPVVIVVADKTRLCGYPLVLPWLVELLGIHGVTRERIVFLIAYGNHRPQSKAESLAAYGPIYCDFPFIHHCSTDPGFFVDLGRTSRGTPVRVRKELLTAGLILTVGAISHHYFAGFGGGRKLLFPGLGEQEAIACNHRLLLDGPRRSLAAGCRPGQLTDNPLAVDLAEVNERLPPYLSIHGLLDSNGQVAAFRFGRNYQDFLQVCQEHDQHYRSTREQKFDLVLASAGGYPKDINMIQAHKAIDNAAAFVRDQGTLIVLAECADGIGSTTFLPYFELGGWDQAFDQLATDYRGNGGTALALMAKTRRITVALVTALAPELCQRIGLSRLSRDQVAGQLSQDHQDLAVISNSSLLVCANNA